LLADVWMVGRVANVDIWALWVALEAVVKLLL
jgi:hypothetical protein